MKIVYYFNGVKITHQKFWPPLNQEKLEKKIKQ